MSDALTSQEERELQSQVEHVRGKLDGLTADLGAVDEELERLAPQRTQHELLDQACGSLEKLGELGAAGLFWGDRTDPSTVAEQLREVRDRVGVFEEKLAALNERREGILAAIGQQEEGLEILAEDIYHAREEEELRKLEWVIEREISPLPRRIQAMAWARGGEDDRRFRKALVASMVFSLLLGLLFPLIDLPLSARSGTDEVPRRLVQFIREAQVRPIELSAVVAELSERDLEEQVEEETVDASEPEPGQPPVPDVPEVAAANPEPTNPEGAPGPLNPELAPGALPGPPARDVASTGILAFQDQLASLAGDRVAPLLGADARFGNANEVSEASTPSRSMLTTNAPGSSGGIDLSSLSRNVGGGGGGGGGGAGGNGGGGGGGGGMPGVEVGRATSSIAAIAGDDRPLAGGGPGLSRTDEEIQIVFDRHKAEFYRFYNRELRNNPALQGQMVLRLTIEPDGSVSMCELQSTDMDAPNLATQVVNRVRTIDFGAKEGVQAMTIVYPIDFLPASDR